MKWYKISLCVNLIFQCTFVELLAIVGTSVFSLMMVYVLNFFFLEKVIL